MRRALVPFVLLLALIASACGDDDSASSAPPTTAEPSRLASDDDGPSADGSVDEASECEALASAAAADQAADSFPDNPHNTWAVAGSSTDEAGRAVVEVVPTPDDVGYPRFRFVSRCEGDRAVFLGAYALDGGAWVLLFTTNEPGASELVSDG
jgi:hypothetical protein